MSQAGNQQQVWQDTLFGPGGDAPSGYDEFRDTDGAIRPAWRELGEAVAERGGPGLDRLRSDARTLVDNEGITYNRVDRSVPWELDPIPLIVSSSDWEALEAGLLQRARLLDAILTDFYGERSALTAGVFPPELLFGHPGYLRAAHGIEIPGRHQLFLYACDVSRDDGSSFVVNADWTQAPSGAGYALAGRRAAAHTIPDLYERTAPRPTSSFAQALRLALIEAAPEGAEHPVVVVLSPGVHSETAFDQAYLASVLGFPLVESADLVVRDGALWMRSLGSFERVDVVLRRVDALYSDPLDLRADSRLGVVGLVEVQRRGAVTVVNTLGSGILESPAVRRFLPELAQHLLGETPLLESAPSYWGGIEIERAHLLANLPSLVIRSTVGGPAIVGPSLSADRRAELTARISAEPWQWVGHPLPQFSSAPTGHRPGPLGSAEVGMRLFTVSQRGGYAPMIGGLGYVLASGPGAYALNSIAAKDVWVLPAARAATEQAAAKLSVATAEASVHAPGSGAVSSPRALSDLFWTGRYAERAENMARLLAVTRDRFHEYRHRQHTAASECVPVLLTALGEITGTPADPDADHTEMIAVAPTTLWSLTADRDRTGSLAHSVKRLGRAVRGVRDQLSNDTWMVLAAVDRAMQLPASIPETHLPGDSQMAAAQAGALSGLLALSGVAAESMVRDVGWAMMDTGKRIERGLMVAGLLDATLTARRNPDAERVITDAVLVVCESSVIYRRRHLDDVRIAAVAELLLFDASNPRSLVYQLDQLRAGLRLLPGASGSSRPERLVEEITTRLRRIDPAELERVVDGKRTALHGVLDGVQVGLRELADVITATQLSLPTGMQPLWTGAERRQLP